MSADSEPMSKYCSNAPDICKICPESDGCMMLMSCSNCQQACEVKGDENR